MKCPICGTWSEVIATREAPHGMTKRRRRCANEHRFNTFEVLPTVITEREAARTAATTATRQRLWARDQAIVSDPRTATLVAAEHKLTEARVRQIRAKPRKKGGDAS